MPAGLGSQFVEATIALAGQQNAGNWTAVFTPQVIGIQLPNFECYHIVVDGGPAGSKFTVTIGTRLYSSVTPGFDTEWDPSQTMKLESGDTVYFYWNSGTGTAPTVYMYFQESELI